MKKQKPTELQVFLGEISSYVYHNTGKRTLEIQSLIREYLKENPDNLIHYTENTGKTLKRCRGAYKDKRENILNKPWKY